MFKIMMPGMGKMMDQPTPDNPDPDGDGDNDLDPSQDTDQDQGNPDNSSPKKFSADKVDQSVVVYMGPEHGPFLCGKCEHFDGQNSCNIVSGDIDPNGCCNLFTPMSGGDEDESGEDSADQEPDQTEDSGGSPQGEDV